MKQNKRNEKKWDFMSSTGSKEKKTTGNLQVHSSEKNHPFRGTWEPELTNVSACTLCVPASISPGRLLSASVGKNHAYQKLPQQPLKLFVIKLDGSSFEVEVSNTATVAELKEAVKGQKLLDYKAYIRLFGIKDGDQICFVRHVSIKYEGRVKRRIRLWRKRIYDSPAYEQLVMNNHYT
ncbi:Ubiquitin-like superfamily protein [Prunus dulcis]|uniref:Ubiquitin-like superfamily protein n=1 Tax=Prunus dulcis TaxID=3755 RepID=A0A4Y1RX22_PRUDU|nr:Ubiquitin-like superfamily protein [Prunus dulcis]